MAAVVACASFVSVAPSASAESSLEGTATALSTRQAHVDPTLAGFAREERLAYAAQVATRAADGRRIVVAFVDVPDLHLDYYRDRLYERLRLGQNRHASAAPVHQDACELVYDARERRVTWERLALPFAGVVALASILIAGGALVLRRATRPPT